MPLKTILLCLTTVIFISCKKVVETIPVFFYEDISIPETIDVSHFSFPSPDIGYAAGSKLYKTTDGGKTWSALSLQGTISGIEFVSPSVGVCILNNSIMHTLDGGETWTFKEHAQRAASRDGVIVAAKEGFTGCTVLASSNGGDTFEYVGVVSVSGSLTSISFCENFAFLNGSQTYSSDNIYGIEVTGKRSHKKIVVTTTAKANPTGVYIDKRDNAIVGGDGYIGTVSGDHRVFYGHTYDFESVDGSNGLIVAVGYNTIVTNLKIGEDEKFNEVFDKSQNGFSNHFLKVKFINSKIFVVSGKNGVIYKGSL